MSLDYAAEKFGTAISILAGHPERIQERLRPAYAESLIRIERQDIPERLLADYDSIVARFAWVENNSAPPSDDDAGMLGTAILDLSCRLEDELR